MLNDSSARASEKYRYEQVIAATKGSFSEKVRTKRLDLDVVSAAARRISDGKIDAAVGRDLRDSHDAT